MSTGETTMGLGETTSDSLYEQCAGLFDEYPEAVTPISHDGGARTMTLITRDGGDPRFFILSHQADDYRPFCRIRPWGAGGVAIEADGSVDASVPEELVYAVAHGVPFPRDGSLFGWKGDSDTVQALIQTYADSMKTPEPAFAVKPRVGTPENEWPSFTGEPLFGDWFWQEYRSGRVVNLAPTINETAGQVFFAHGAIIADYDVVSPDGFTLPAGTFAYYRELQAGGMPDEDEQLTGPTRVDLGGRFTSF